MLIRHSILILQIVADTYADLVANVANVDFQAQIHRSAERGPLESNNDSFFVAVIVDVFVFVFMFVFNRSAERVPFKSNNDVAFVYVFVFTFLFHRSAERGPFESNQAPLLSSGVLTYFYKFLFFISFLYFHNSTYHFYLFYISFIFFSLAVVDCLYCGIILPCNAVRLLGCWYWLNFFFQKLFCV